MMKKQIYFLFVVLAMAAGHVHAAVANEWTFGYDDAGLPLSIATNTGPGGAAFSDDLFGATKTDGKGGLVVANNISGVGNFRTEGIFLSAPEAATSTFIRFDLDYDFTAAANDSGSLLSMNFTDSSGSTVSGAGLKYDLPIGFPRLVTSGYSEVDANPLPGNLSRNGTISMIAEFQHYGSFSVVFLYWDLTGANAWQAYVDQPFQYVGNSLSAIEKIQFQATGDFIASSSNDCVVIDNIRTADSWESITAPPPADPTGASELLVTVSDDLGGRMETGQTNQVYVAVRNIGGINTRVQSTLTYSGNPGDFTITSSNTPISLFPNETVTNLYQVVAHSDGSFILSAQGFSDQTTNAPVDFTISVGSLIELESYSLMDAGGVFPGEVEPSETIDLFVTNINSGGVTVTGLTNSLVPANPAYFSGITPASDVYAVIAPGERASTHYRVTVSPSAPVGTHTLSVVNRTATKTWTDSIPVSVVRRAVPSVSQASLTLRAAPGGVGTGSVILTNRGNASISFSVADDGHRPFSYQSETQAVGRAYFNPAVDFYPETVFSAWNGTETVPMDIGFEFPMFGNVSYTSFSVSRYGFITLTNSSGDSAIITPFGTASGVAVNTVRYRKLDDSLLVAWGNGTGQEFQARLNRNGDVEYFYEYGIWGSGTIAIQNDENEQTFTHVPGQTGTDSLLLTPGQTWVSYSPLSGTVGSLGGQNLTFTATPPADQVTGSHAFTATVHWGNGSSSDLEVTVIVEPETPKLTVPATFAFSGPAGGISPPAILTMTNSGNVALNFSVVNRSLQTAGYTWEEGDYSWQFVPPFADFILEESELGIRQVPIGFPFVFFGTTYTSLTVGVDGTLTLGDEQTIVPFAAGLSMSDDSQVRFLTDMAATRFMVTWEHMEQPGGDDQTFQTVLYRNGLIHFNYKTLSGDWPDGAIQLTYGTNTTIPATLSNANTTVVQTNLIYETISTTQKIGNVYFVTETNRVTGTNVVVTYKDTVTGQAIDFVPGSQQIISVSPLSGTIAVGGTFDLRFSGDARSLTDGGTNRPAVTNLFNILSGAGTKSVDVTFAATNSVDSVYPAITAEAAMWGLDEVGTVSIETSKDGLRVLSWPGVQNDSFPRTYTVYYTTSLTGKWTLLKTVINQTVCTDDLNINAPVIFYKVTVE